VKNKQQHKKTELITAYKNRQFMKESVTASDIQASSFLVVTYSPAVVAGNLKNV
jgi:hypothetical protein